DYLTTPEIFIARKSGLTEIGPNDVYYAFELNHTVDSTWRELFESSVDGVTVEITGTLLQIRCGPANLEGRYNKVKAAIANTNSGYVAHKKDLMAKVATLDEQRKNEKEANENRTQALKDQFGKLQL